MGVDLVRGDRRPHLIDKIGLPKLPCTDVHRKQQSIGVRVILPGLKLDTRLLEDPTADWDHQSGFFGELNKAARPDQPTFRVIPSDQRLRSECRSRLINLQLEIEFKLRFLDRFSQIALKLSSFSDRLLHAVIKKTQPIATLVLGLIHRDVGLFEQFIKFGLIFAKQGDADAARTVMRVGLELKGFVQTRQNFFPHRFGSGAGLERMRTQICQDDQKLVPTQARHDVAFAHTLEQTLGDLLQQQITNTVTTGVI